MIKYLQVYKSDCLNPYENLAVEKCLLDSVDDETVILYLWRNEKTVVIGRNQNSFLECRCRELEADGGKLARRLSGGGAVFHDTGNLNFTFLCKTENYDLEKQLNVIKTACELAGIETEFSGRNDILADGRKFSGNAFYNSKGRSYHHGTILINADMLKMQKYLSPPEAKLQSKGVKSVRSRVVNLSELCPRLTCKTMADYMVRAFEKVYNLASVPAPACETEKVLALKEEYGSYDYLYKMPIPFSTSLKDRFSWGTIELSLEISNGIVTGVTVFSDSMDFGIRDKIEKALLHCPFKEDKIYSSLLKVFEKNVADDIFSLIRNQLL